MKKTASKRKRERAGKAEVTPPSDEPRASVRKKLTTNSDLKDLTILGGKQGIPGRKLEAFPNHHPERDYWVTLHTEEFTCLCPLTGQPDFAKLKIEYVPNGYVLESKSLKLYLQSFRNEGTFHEHVVNVILDDIVGALAPRSCKVTAEFAVRGGIGISVEAEFNSRSNC
jgi:7-cyano-7-deazaguanine reductase